MQSRILHLSIRIMFLIVGVLIILTIIPHETPWKMSNVVRVINPPLYVDINPVGWGRIFRISEMVAVLLLLIGFALPLSAIHSLRQAFVALKNKKLVLFSAILATESFLFTLIPVSNDLFHDAKAGFLFMMMGLLGVTYVSIGVAPIARWLVSFGSLKAWILKLYGIARWMILDSPLIAFLTVLFIVEFTLTNIISYFVFEHIPHIQDSIAQVFHGKIFAEGHLTVPSSPHKEFFDFLHVINNGRWYSQYPPGHSLLLMVGVIIGAPWVINPFIGSLTVVVLYFLGKELYSPVVGRLSALLAILSPFILFMSSEFMNHTSALLFFVVFFLFFAKALRSGLFLHGAVAGSALGWVACIRPYSAAALAFPFLTVGLFQFLKRFHEVKKSIFGFSLFFLLFMAALAGFNVLTNGSPFVFGYELLWGTKANPGFGRGAWGPPHTPLLGLLHTINNFNGLNKFLFEWPIPSLLPATLLFFTGRINRWDVLLFSTVWFVAGAHFFYWFQDLCFGPRFLYEASGLLLVLTARCIEQLPALWSDVLGFTTSFVRVRVGSAAIFLFLITLGLAINLPPHVKFYSDDYWGVNGKLLKAAEKRGISRAVIFVRSYYGGGFVGNDPLLDNSVIYARDLGAKNKLLMELYPAYDYYLAVEDDLQRIVKE
ncbi:MAG TPA: glycosyltransferase family 39 protein [Bacteroidota bacterium]|nr:glycosyltransferase family 39 protein [Bacteroidota bacterium]